MARDFYEILGVQRSASKDEIKKAFHKLAHKYHPDKSTGDDAKFKEVNEAYQVLSDDKKRAEYDTYGRVFQGGAGPQGGGFGGFGDGGFNVEFDASDLGDMFGDFFGGGFGGGRERVRRGNDIAIDTEITFEESIFGVERTVTLRKTSTCETCDGAGAKPGTKTTSCKACNGKGKINDVRKSIFGSFATVRTCDVCEGIGHVPEEKCKTCDGDGVLKRQEEITFVIPSGIRDGEMIRMSGKGEAISRGVAGDLYIKVHVRSHKTFRREGNNLLMDLQIKLTDALLGANYTVEGLDKKMIDVKVPEGVKFGDILRVREKGVPGGRNGKNGDLMIHVKIEIPQRISGKAKKLIQELREEGM